jgi:hypothetical protein
MALVFKATIVDLESQILLDFRLSRGDGIEFKKRLPFLCQLFVILYFAICRGNLLSVSASFARLDLLKKLRMIWKRSKKARQLFLRENPRD